MSLAPISLTDAQFQAWLRASKPIDLNAMMTPAQAAAWLQVKLAWLLKRWGVVPGCITESRKVKLFHPLTYVETRLKKARRA